MGSFRRSWELMKESFAILKSDKQLMLLPTVSGICCIFVSSLIMLSSGLSVFLIIRYTDWKSPHWLDSLLIWTAVFVLYLVNYIVIVFFYVALIAAASERLASRSATLRGGVAMAWRRRGKVVQWAVLAATVGVILQMIGSRLGVVARLVTKLLGAVWELASYFVAPVLIFEDLGPVDALKRSARIFREAWGEQIVSQFSMGAIFMLFGLAGFGVWFVVMTSTGTMGLYY